MILLLALFMLVPEFFELLDDLIIFADLLLDGKQHGIERKHRGKHYPESFRFHNGPP
jgi:hypothetical protein